MARPKKQTIDYFPHQVGNGKTKLILQNEFGNDGYAFWFQLLELLCVSDNQVYGYNNPASWRLLLAETHVTEDNAIKILQLLADLGAIDSELHKNKVIWSQNLIDNLELVYRRRATGIPERPVIADKNEVIDNNNRQTILNNTKQYKRGEEVSATQQYLFNILLRCPAIKKSDSVKLPELLKDYPGINYELEFKKFVEWWPGPKKRKKPWVVLRNWLGQAQPDETKLTDSGRYKKL